MQNEELTLLTEGYEPIAQMSIGLADQLGYLDKANIAIVNPRGDDSSAKLPYFVDVYCENGSFHFLLYDARSVITVDGNYQVLVYRKPPLPVLSPEAEIDLLDEFARQFAPDSPIRILLSDELLAWVKCNPERPDIYWEFHRMRLAAYRLEENINALEETME